MNKNTYAVIVLGAVIATTGTVGIASAMQHGEGRGYMNGGFGKGWQNRESEQGENRGQGRGREMHSESGENNSFEQGEHQGNKWGRGDDNENSEGREGHRGMGRGEAQEHDSDNRGGKMEGGDEHTLDFSVYPMGVLTDAEKVALIHMREEEKMARDVYRTLSKTTDSRAFVNIPVSEGKHMDVFSQLIERYSLVDPIVDESAVGVFADSFFTDTYTELVAKGQVSDKEAFFAGAMVEDLNMSNLIKYGAATDKPDLKAAYDQLLTQSQHHMSAFIRNLDKLGETFTPQYITQAQLDASVSAGKEHMQDEARRGGEMAQEMENEIGTRNTTRASNSAIQSQITALQELLKGLLRQFASLFGA